MSAQNLLRFLLGIVIAAILLYFILPFAGVPSSQFLPPAFVYSKAQGETHGWATGKYFEGGNNAFAIGSDNYFVNYAFKAHAPAPRGSVQPGPVQTYTGTVHISQDTYGQFASTQQQQDPNNPTPGQVNPLPPYPLKVQFSKTNPAISGIDETWAQSFQQGRSISPGSNTIGLWMIWIVVTIVLGFFISMALAKIMKSEDI